MTSKTAIGSVGRVSLAEPLRGSADLRSGDRVYFRHLGKGRLEVRAFPRLTWDDIVARYGSNEPIGAVEQILREEERRLADEFR